MAENRPQSAQIVGISKEDLQELLSSILAKAEERMNPADRIVFDEQMSRMARLEQFKAIMAADVAAQKARAAGCTHRRWPKGHDLAGHPAPRGQGEWVTGGQLHGSGRQRFAALTCLRGCGATWLFFPSDGEFAYLEDSGMLGWVPPAENRLLERCTWCSKLFPKLTVHEHEEGCAAKPVPSPMKQAIAPNLAAVLTGR